MITKDQERKMVAIVRKSFINKEEAAGGMGYRYFHSLRVYGAAKALLDSDEVRDRKVDRDAVLVAALFHDIGRAEYDTVDPEMPGHDEKSAAFIRNRLGKIVSKDLAARAAGIMDDYDDRGRSYLEKDILVSADLLDKLGALNIWRSFVYGSYKKLTAKDRLDYWNYENKKWNKKWMNLIRIKVARKLAKQRIKVTRSFMKELQCEYDGKDLLSLVNDGKKKAYRS